MKFIKHMLGFYLLIAITLAVFFWPFLVFSTDKALPIFLAWILFAFFTAIGISFYAESKGGK